MSTKNKAGLPYPSTRKDLENRILGGTGKCLICDFDSNQDICPTINEEFIPGSVLFPGPVLACMMDRPTGRRTHPRKRKRKKPRGSLPHPSWKSQAPAAQGRGLAKQFKTRSWCVAMATTPAARQLGRRSKHRREGYSWGSVEKSHLAQALRQRE